MSIESERPLHTFNWLALFVALGTLAAASGCQSSRHGGAEHTRRALGEKTRVRAVRCIYEQRPWLNLDRFGDRDPEGIRYRVFLDAGEGRGVLREGTFHIELYQVDRDTHGRELRFLVSDWHYPTSACPKIAKPGQAGEGYFVHLRWAKKDIAGREIELITQFEDPEGRKVRSGTRRLRVPKYSS